MLAEDAAMVGHFGDPAPQPAQLLGNQGPQEALALQRVERLAGETGLPVHLLGDGAGGADCDGTHGLQAPGGRLVSGHW